MHGIINFERYFNSPSGDHKKLEGRKKSRGFGGNVESKCKDLGPSTSPCNVKFKELATYYGIG